MVFIVCFVPPISCCSVLVVEDVSFRILSCRPVDLSFLLSMSICLSVFTVDVSMCFSVHFCRRV